MVDTGGGHWWWTLVVDTDVPSSLLEHMNVYILMSTVLRINIILNNAPHDPVHFGLVNKYSPQTVKWPHPAPPPPPPPPPGSWLVDKLVN